MEVTFVLLFQEKLLRFSGSQVLRWNLDTTLLFRYTLKCNVILHCLYSLEGSCEYIQSWH